MESTKFAGVQMSMMPDNGVSEAREEPCSRLDVPTHFEDTSMMLQQGTSSRIPNDETPMDSHRNAESTTEAPAGRSSQGCGPSRQKLTSRNISALFDIPPPPQVYIYIYSFESKLDVLFSFY